MAFRKETIKKQFNELIPQILERDEAIKVGSLTVSGPSPYLQGAVGVPIMLLLGMRYYYVVATDRRVIFVKSSMLTGRPNDTAWADPRDPSAVSDVTMGKLWSHLKYRRADGKTIRLNFHRIWREEMTGLVQAITGQAPAP